MDGYSVGGAENWLKLLGSEESDLDIPIVAGQECCVPEVSAFAVVVQYLHLWDEESKCTLSNVVDCNKGTK